MSEKKDKTTPPENIPAFVKKAPELLPVWDWWVKEGKSTVCMVLLAAAAVAAFYGVRNYMRSRDAAANAALATAYTVEDLEAAAATHGSTAVAPAIKLRLAKAYYDSGNYARALETYESVIAQSDEIPAFADIAQIGKAYSLEGLERYEEAGNAFSSTNSFLALQARLGCARCQALAGDKDAALKSIDQIKADMKDDAMAVALADRLAETVKRYKPRSLFEKADAAEKSAEAEAKPAEAAAKPATSAK